ncbi:hypothetical protein HPP92_025422 [Vanilla planifolia]|uniref:Methyltransferase n=1 Tax=Vanilla planifolia TaxID=51239 RepID=A0A835PHI7_VANPL|nr:hypothetical protein HPP92_025422 [Vanilla planifolia]
MDLSKKKFKNNAYIEQGLARGSPLPIKESSLEDGPAFAREKGDSTAHSESAASNEESSETQKNTWARDQETQNQGDAGGISSQAQIEHDSDGTIDDHQHQSQDSNSPEEEQQRQEQQLQEEDNLSHETEQNQPSVEQQANDHDDRGQQSDVQQLENEEHKQDEENGNDSQEEIQEHTNESRQQQQLQQQMEEDRGNENQLRFNVGNDESHSNEYSLSNPTVNASFSDTNQLEEPSKGGDSDDRPWEAQVVQSRSDAESQISSGNAANLVGYEWELCNTTAGTDYIPCLDNMKAIKKLNSFKHYRHRERHCPEDAPTCLVPLPEGYKRSIAWPKSRDKIWYNNVPRTKLAEVKGHQNWVKVEETTLHFQVVERSSYVVHFITLISFSSPSAMLNGGSTHVLYSTLAVVLQASVAIYLREMYSQCLLHQRMNMKLKSSLLSSEAFQPYLLLWAPNDFHSQALFLTLYTVRGVVCHGMQMEACFFWS